MDISTLRNGLIRCNSAEVEETSLVAAAVWVGEAGDAGHCGIYIRCAEGQYICHYEGNEIKIDELTRDNESWYFYKGMPFVSPQLADTFLGQCRAVRQYANPSYGFVFTGDFYNEDGYFTNKESVEYMTCVGFCLYVIKGVLVGASDDSGFTEIFHYEDWGTENIPETGRWLQQYVERMRNVIPGISEDLIMSNLRRIDPVDYLAGAYIEDLPIRKAIIDSFKEDLLTVIAENR